MRKNNDKNTYKNVISINDVRKKKGLPPVECVEEKVSKEEKEERLLDEKIEALDTAYEDYIVTTKGLSDDKEKMKAFKDLLDRFNVFFDFIYEKETKKMLQLSPLKEEINYAMTGAGKRLRPFLMYLTYRAFGGEVTEDLVNFMIAIELIHSFSLIHDDMPCMDNDELRRGKESVWKKFGEAKALLAGDAMISMAQEIAGYTLLDAVLHQDRYTDDIEEDFDENGEVYLDEEDVEELRYNAHEAFVYTACIQMLASATGAQGMVAGQADELDLQDKKDLKVEDIIGMYSYKTGALLS
ncbi:MAG: polyprenyl synthetase family protein, partial [Lachnospiraceae bacterium]|nr:polyprenyl synthetase family protein [Lachnospiraceae bacterium]